MILHSPYAKTHLIINIPRCYYESSTGKAHQISTVSFLFPAGYFNPRSETLIFDCAFLDISRASKLRFTTVYNQKDHLLIRQNPNAYLKQLELLNTNAQKKLLAEVDNYQVFQSGVENLTVVFKEVPQGMHPISFTFLPATRDSVDTAFPAVVYITTIVADEYLVKYALRADRMSIYRSGPLGTVDELMHLYLNGESIQMRPDFIQKIVQNNEKITRLIEKNIVVVQSD